MTNYRDTARLYERVWSQRLYGGFSQGTSGERTTPLLEALVERLSSYPARNRRWIRVVEGGAGSGYHSIELASRGYSVTAIDSSPTAVKIMEQNTRQAGLDGRLTPVEADLLDYLRIPSYIDHASLNEALRFFPSGARRGLWRLSNGLSANLGRPELKIDAFYANAVLHFLPPSRRRRLWGLLSERQTPQGIAAVSFKAQGDALQNDGEVVKTVGYGIVVGGNDGITRLFVSDPVGLIVEARAEGYSVRDGDIFEWEVPDYNIPGQTGRFIGFIAERGQQ